MNHPHHHSSDDLLLQATRYVLEEMDAPELAQFEQLLLEDQPAREAVESAVELLVATQAAQEAVADRRVSRGSVTGSTLPRTRQLIGWLSAVAACLLVAAIVSLGSRPLPPENDVAQVAPTDAIDQEHGNEHRKGLAQAWARSLADEPDRANMDRGLWWDSELVADLTEVEDAAALEDPALEDALALAPPSWMLTALAAQQEQTLPATDLTEQVEESRQ